MSVGRLRGVSSKEVDGRAERYRHVRPELLERLTDYIATHGLHGLTMRNLAAGAGVSHPTFLYHFTSREALLAEVSQHVRRRLVDAAQAAVPPESTDDLYRWWRSLADYDRPLDFLLVIELYLAALRDPEERVDAAFVHCLRALAPASGSGQHRPGGPEVTRS